MRAPPGSCWTKCISVPWSIQPVIPLGLTPAEGLLRHPGGGTCWGWEGCTRGRDGACWDGGVAVGSRLRGVQLLLFIRACHGSALRPGAHRLEGKPRLGEPVRVCPKPHSPQAAQLDCKLQACSHSVRTANTNTITPAFKQRSRGESGDVCKGCSYKDVVRCELWSVRK